MRRLSPIPPPIQDAPPYPPATANSVFPVFYSTLDSQALAKLIFSNYNVEIIKTCQFWHRGLSDIYLIETLANKFYIFRISHRHWRSKTEIDFELEFLDFLQQRQLPVAAPIKTKTGKLSVVIEAPEGQRQAALFPYAPGEVALGDLNPTQSYLLGEIVAKLHQASREFTTLAYRQPLTVKYLLDDSLQVIAPFLHHSPKDLNDLVGTIARIKQQLKDLPTEIPYWGICWGDPHSGNVHFTPDNRMTLFDFDQCSYGWRSFDIAKFLQVSFQSGLGQTVKAAFLNGYQAVEKITERELDAIKALTQTAHIWAWAISLNSSMWQNYSRLDKSYFLQRLQQLKRLNCNDWLSWLKADR